MPSDTPTEKIDARIAEHARREAQKEASNHTAPAPKTDDLPVTRKNVKLVWAILVVVLGAMATSSGVVWKAFNTAADQRHAISTNATHIAELREWKTKYLETEDEHDREIQKALTGIEKELAAMNVKLELLTPR